MFFFFFFFSSLDWNRENCPRFSNPDGLTVVRTVHWVFCLERVSEFKEPFQKEVLVNPVRSGFQNNDLNLFIWYGINKFVNNDVIIN